MSIAGFNPAKKHKIVSLALILLKQEIIILS